MTYLDYSATTPVIDDVLDSFNKVTKEFFGNPYLKVRKVVILLFLN